MHVSADAPDKFKGNEQERREGAEERSETRELFRDSVGAKMICWKDKRPLLYATLVETFGPLETWVYPSRPSPGNGLDAAYQTFLVSFAAEHNAKSDQAVLQQIRYTTQANIRTLRGGQITCLLRNLLVAVEHKFVTPEYVQAKLLEQALK